MNQELVKKLTSVLEDERFDAWYQVYYVLNEEGVHFIEKVCRGNDLILKLYLARFCAEVQEPRAVEIIILLMSDPAAQVFEVAQRCFEKNRFSEKNKYLITLLDSEQQAPTLYAIQRLATTGLTEAVPYLLKLLSHEVYAEKIIATLRFYRDRRILPVIVQYLQDSREYFRYHAILSYGSLYDLDPFYTRSYLYRALHDPNEKMRRAAIWCLRRSSKNRDKKYLLPLSIQDPEPAVRYEAIAALANFPSLKLVKHLMDILLSEIDTIVLLKTEAILLSLPQKILVKSLYGLLHHQNQRMRNKIIILLSQFEGSSEKLVVILEQELKSIQQMKDAFPLLQALGNLKSSAAIKILEKYLNRDPLTAFVALGAILKIAKADYFESCSNYLADANMAIILKQNILKFLLKQPISQVLTPVMQEILLTLLYHPNLNLRYLSFELLVQSKDKKIYLKVLDYLFTKEQDAFFQDEWDHFYRFFSENYKVVFEYFKMISHQSAIRDKFLQFTLQYCQHCRMSQELTHNFIEIFMQTDDVLMHPVFWEIIQLLYSQQMLKIEWILKVIFQQTSVSHYLQFLLKQLPASKQGMKLSFDFVHSYLTRCSETEQTVLLQIMTKHGDSACLAYVTRCFFESLDNDNKQLIRKKLQERLECVA